LPHPNHTDGGFCLSALLIDAIKQQDGRRPDPVRHRFRSAGSLPGEFPPAIYLTPRPDLGDVSQGKAGLAHELLREMFNGILTPRQLEGLRVLLTPFRSKAVQCDRGSPFGDSQHRRSLL